MLYRVHIATDSSSQLKWWYNININKWECEWCLTHIDNRLDISWKNKLPFDEMTMTCAVPSSGKTRSYLPEYPSPKPCFSGIRRSIFRLSINKTNNLILPPQLNEHKKYNDIWLSKSRYCLWTGTHMWRG